MSLLLAQSAAAYIVGCGRSDAVPLYCHRTSGVVRMLDVDHAKLPYNVPPLPKPFSDYEYDPSYPGSFKPGTRGENQDLDKVLEDWKDRDNPACMQLAQDELWQVCGVWLE